MSAHVCRYFECVYTIYIYVGMSKNTHSHSHLQIHKLDKSSSPICFVRASYKALSLCRRIITSSAAQKNTCECINYPFFVCASIFGLALCAVQKTQLMMLDSQFVFSTKLQKNVGIAIFA